MALKCLARVDLPEPLCPSTATKLPSSIEVDAPEGLGFLVPGIGVVQIFDFDD
jgi:hypothetical protein